MGPIKRIDEIDFVKGLLVIFMVIYHSLNFHGISPNRYMQFLPPSFIMVTGFILTQVFFPKYLRNNTGAKMRLAIRGVKIILIFTILNMAGRLLWPIYGHGIFSELGYFFGDWIDIYIFGSPKTVAFDILLPISYTILLALLILNLKIRQEIFTILFAIIIFGACLIMEYHRAGIFTINMLSAGIIGMALGFIPITLVDRFAEYWKSNAFLVICSVVVFFAGHNYFTQISSTILSLVIFYLIGLRINLTSFSSRAIILLGRYSLLGYILQIVYLKLYFAGSPIWLIGKKQILITVFFVAMLTYISVLIVNNARLKSKHVDTFYKAVFA